MDNALDKAIERVETWANLADSAGHSAAAYRTPEGEVHLLLVSDLDTIIDAVNKKENNK